MFSISDLRPISPIYWAPVKKARLILMEKIYQYPFESFNMFNPMVGRVSHFLFELWIFMHLYVQRIDTLRVSMNSIATYLSLLKQRLVTREYYWWCQGTYCSYMLLALFQRKIMSGGKNQMHVWMYIFLLTQNYFESNKISTIIGNQANKKNVCLRKSGCPKISPPGRQGILFFS